MKTISNLPGAGRPLLAFALLLALWLPAFGQEPEFIITDIDANQKSVTVKLPALVRDPGSSHLPAYDLLIHWGDGNIERATATTNLVHDPATDSYGFNDWTGAHHYSQAATHRPTLSLTAKYTPPQPPKRHVVFPPGGTVAPGSASATPYSMTGNLLGGRALSLSANHRFAHQAGSSTTLALAWDREAVPPESDVALFYGGLRNTVTNDLRASNPANNPDGSIMGLRIENHPHLAQYGLALTTATASSNAAFYVLELQGHYDSAFIMRNVVPDGSLEGRNFLILRNNSELVYQDTSVSLLALVLTNEDLVPAAQLAKLPGFKKLDSLNLAPGTAGGLRLGANGPHIFDFIFIEERPVYIHDPNELIITKKTQQGNGDWALEFEYTSCSLYKSNMAVERATVVVEESHLIGGTLAIGNARQPGQSPSPYEPNPPIPPPMGAVAFKRFENIKLMGGQCFVIEMKGTLAAAEAARLNEDGKILHACVYFEGESNPDRADICAANRRWDESLLPQTPPDPCLNPTGLWPKIKCLCAQSPVPCWLIALIVLLIALFYFFKKNN